jgi:glycosyltransferase involved in cell wall biosynthesis
MKQRRIFVLAPSVPFPPIGGSRTRTFHLVRALAAQADVTVAGFAYDDRRADNPPFSVRMVEIPWEWPPLYRAMKAGDVAATEALANLDEPWFASVLQSEAMEATVARLSREADIVLIEHSAMARFLPFVAPTAQRVLDFVDVQTSAMLRARTEAAAADDTEVVRTQRFERRAASASDLCLVCSTAEASRAAELFDAERVAVVPNGVDTSYFSPSASGDSVVPGSLLFTGTMDYEPNIQAVQFFARAIFPLVARNLPSATFHIVGRDPVPTVRELAGHAVAVHGAVPDVRPYFERAEQVVVPILWGGGTRIKILEAAAAGKAIVTTSLGVEGLDFVPDEELLIANDPDAFAAAVLRVAADWRLRRRLGAAARAASLSYDWSRIGSTLCRLVLGQPALAAAS